MKDTAFDIISLNDSAVLVKSKLYKKNEVVKTIHTDIEGVASTSSDLLPYGKFRIVESEAPDGYLTDGAKPIDFTITENGKIVDLTDEAHSIYNQIKRGDIAYSADFTLWQCSCALNTNSSTPAMSRKNHCRFQSLE